MGTDTSFAAIEAACVIIGDACASMHYLKAAYDPFGYTPYDYERD